MLVSEPQTGYAEGGISSLRYSSSKTTTPSLILRKTSDKPQLRGSLQNYSPVLLKIAKVIKNGESLRNCHRPEEPKDRDMMTKCNEVHWTEPWNRKRTLVKNQVKSKQILLNWTVMHQFWFLSFDKYMTVMLDVNIGGNESDARKNPLNYLCSFSVNPKLFQKLKLIF